MRSADERYGFNLLYPVMDNRVELSSHLAKSQVEQWKDPIVRGKRLTGIKKLHSDPEWKDRRREALQRRWQDPEFRAKMLGVLQKNVAGFVHKMATQPGYKENRMRGINKPVEE